VKLFGTDGMPEVTPDTPLQWTSGVVRPFACANYAPAPTAAERPRQASSMVDIEFLQSYSEIAVAIIGFSGVVVVLRRRHDEVQAISLGMLVLFGSGALVLGILPQILIQAGIEPKRIWQGLSFAIVMSQIVGGIARTRQAKKRGVGISALGGIGFSSIMVGSIVVAASNVYFGEFWVYMTNLLLYLLASIAIFRNLVGLNSNDV